MKNQRLYYGWFDPRAQTFRVSREPPDAILRPSVECATMDQVKDLLKRYRATILWSPALPPHLKSASPALVSQ